LKDQFFNYFTTEELKKLIKIEGGDKIVTVKLQIPVERGTIDFKKEYKASEMTLVEPTIDFDCALFPNVKFKEEKDAFYRFGLVCDFNEKEKYDAEFVKIKDNIDKNKVRTSTRNETHIGFQLKNYSLESSNFDYIKLTYNNTKGVIVPNMLTKDGENEFTFAVDLGTTNTHIEYQVGDGNEIKPFDISKGTIDERQVHWLHGKEEALRKVFDNEYIPAYTDDEFKFPMRTALSYGEKTNWQDVYPYEKASADELYEKRLDYKYNKIVTNLKWSVDEDNNKKIDVYIKSLMFLLRNKVILNNGNLKKTKIIWFYPVSMEKDRYNNLKNAWSDAYKKYFGGNSCNIVSITESVAPFEYYIKDGNASNVVTIDIGGGTTDIVIAPNAKVDYITSFRFAANTIFGDGYAETNRVKSGIVRQFIDIIRDELLTKINESTDLFSIFDYMKKDKNSADIASFLFSLENNKDVRVAGEELAQNANLSNKLTGDTTQKITFIFFYSAIIYHLAKIMKAKALQMPDKIVFSGNGSRIIPLFTDDDTLKAFTKLIFERVFGQKYPDLDLSIILNKKNPKEATCKGGFFAKNPATYKEILTKKIVLHSNDNTSVIQRSDEFVEKPAETDTYKVINENYLAKTVEEVKIFIQFVFDLLPFFASEGYKLNKVSIDTAKQVCFQKLDIYAQIGWQLKQKEVGTEEVIEETLFFYPLVGMLNALSSAICDKNLKTD